MMREALEIAQWVDAGALDSCKGTSRVYLGHETSFDQMPSLPSTLEAAARLRDAHQSVTLVTPFLTEKALQHVCAMIEAITEVLDCYEVVCNDWGLVQWLSTHRIAEVVAGRFLAGQASDPRLAAFNLAERQIPYERAVQHADGTQVFVKYRFPSNDLMAHLCRCAIDTPAVLEFLSHLGLRRFEISNTLQGIRIAPTTTWKVTLHLPDVPIAVARQRWQDGGNQWIHPSFPVTLYQKDNAVFYRNGGVPANIHMLPIDRVVCRME
jgi:hypothetical protein